MQKEKIKFRLAKVKETYGTSRIGTIHATFDEIVAVFGQPHDRTTEGEWKSRDNKIRVEWAFVINSNKKLVFTVYDYKSRYPLDRIKQWSLGGWSKNKQLIDYLKNEQFEVEFS